jgi:hypothetical protein
MPTYPVPVDVKRLERLLELAEEALDVRDSEYSSYPTDEERDLLLSFYTQIGKPVPKRLMKLFKRGSQIGGGPE